MIRALMASAVFVFALPAMADETARDPRVETMLKDLPSEAEMNEAMAAMPDLNRLMAGMLDIMKDEETQATMKSLGARMSEKLDGKDYAGADGELPDFNAMMADMMGLMSDRELIGDLAELGLSMEDEMKALAEEASAPKVK